MAKKKHPWKEFLDMQEDTKPPLDLSTSTKTEDEIWEGFKNRNYKSMIETTLSWEMN